MRKRAESVDDDDPKPKQRRVKLDENGQPMRKRVIKRNASSQF
jgi:hypothetical protein